MMKLTQYLVPENIQQGVFLSSKKRALELVGKLVAASLNRQCQTELNAEEAPSDNAVCPVECFSQLFKREKLGSTALNHGVALPHSKLPSNDQFSLETPIAVFLQLETPIDFEADDHKEVDLIYAILFPDQHCEQYSLFLGELAEKLGDKLLLKQLRAANSAQDIWAILTNVDYADEQTEPENSVSSAENIEASTSEYRNNDVKKQT